MTESSRRIGIFGGTFDPVHLGHLILAEQGREQGNLDEIWLIPAAQPPHKQDSTLTRFDQRVEMLELAIAGNPTFKIETIENERPDLSYTADTLRELQARHPEADFHLLIGTDSLMDLPGWYQPHQVLHFASLLVMHRAGYPKPSDEQIHQHFQSLTKTVPLRMQWMEDPPLVDLASSNLRQRVKQGRSIRYVVPRAVEAYVKEKKLYLD